MVVPDANGIDLLREHAFYEYGNKEFQSVLDFDYKFALDQFVNHQTSGPIFLLFGLIAAIVSIYLFISHLNKKKRSSILDYSSNIKEQTISYDIESGPPSLSYSNSSTPTNSPDLSKDSQKIRTFRFDDYQPYKQA